MTSTAMSKYADKVKAGKQLYGAGDGAHKRKRSKKFERQLEQNYKEESKRKFFHDNPIWEDFEDKW